MDIYRAIRELEQEKKRLDGVIRSIEELIASGAASQASTPKQKKARKRGRKEMTADERQAVSERMRKYWESRRAKREA